MRLVNAAKLELENFDDDYKRPPYAILSHTWGAEEVSLPHFQDAYTGDEATRKRVRQMSGYAKISRACTQTLNDGYAYIWVDTCCIDKTSSAELSEAINSMYRWYQDAEVCYAFLDDVQIKVQPSDGTDMEAMEHLIGTEGELARARWFRRGWTLQELIAPRDVRFYDANWTMFGTKAHAETIERLKKITSINRSVLLGHKHPSQCSVARRMSWAAQRRTTRTEDIAYCLMGLFQINMPLLYGEGDKAFTRLQEEIMKTDDDQSLFAWNLFEERNNFTNRRHRITRGDPVFAPHPKNFSQTKDIYPHIPHGEPSSVTNQGIRVTLPVLQLQSQSDDNDFESPNGDFFDYFLAVLYCGRTSNERQHPAIVLQKSASETDSQTYARCYRVDIFMVNHDEVKSSDVRQVYLRNSIYSRTRARCEYETTGESNLYERLRPSHVRVYQPRQRNAAEEADYLALLERLHSIRSTRGLLEPFE